MSIDVKYEPTLFVPAYYFDRINKTVSVWEWLTPEAAENMWFEEQMTLRYGKNWRNYE
jgi:hypothetical protein